MKKKVILFAVAVPLTIFGIAAIQGISQAETEKKLMETVGVQSLDSLIGKNIIIDDYDLWGSPETLNGTNSKYWAAYFPKAQITTIAIKGDRTIKYVEHGKINASDIILEFERERHNLLIECFKLDGSHRTITEVIKKTLKDSDNYKHIDTSFSDRDSFLLVTTEFSAKNSFGGVIQNTIQVKTDLDCNIIEIVEWFE
ncbi:hypothetical protein [Flagellimonas nanhaiensis]|uniref:Uncharacterized protein n=1 Tax=Flagellimonas nanhaiensis TaxID=2292706 RepID=A0A371JMT9_9FLAO|nr:hypothetical protein [Allomuricauda nanhaiensis]RDY58464.1 hypothetical protein DX873_15805 [Allomuricauda nanhaiensis]